MRYTFASRRQLSFIITVGFRNLLVQFGSKNQAGVSNFMTQDERVAKVLRRHSLVRRGVIEETTDPQEMEAETAIETEANATGTVAQEPAKEEPAEGTTEATQAVADNPAEETTDAETEANATGTVAEEPTTKTDANATGTAVQERKYDNYSVARETICKEFGIKKADVRNPTALARVAKEHGIIIKYKEL